MLRLVATNNKLYQMFFLSFAIREQELVLCFALLGAKNKTNLKMDGSHFEHKVHTYLCKEICIERR